MPMENMYTKNDLTTNELLILQSEMRKDEKSLGLACLMLLGGHLGLHRFYLKKHITGSIQLVLFILATVSYWIISAASGLLNLSDTLLVIGLVIFAGLPGLALLIWVIIDLFLIGGMVREWNKRTEEKIIHELLLLRRDNNITS